MTWQVLLSGMGLPWIGFSFGFVLAKLLKRPMEDIIAIAIETGIQNTGMSIFILWLIFDHPLGDVILIFSLFEISGSTDDQTIKFEIKFCKF